MGSENHRGQCVRYIDDRRHLDGVYESEAAEDVIAALRARLEAAEKECDEAKERAAHWERRFDDESVRCTMIAKGRDERIAELREDITERDRDLKRACDECEAAEQRAEKAEGDVRSVHREMDLFGIARVEGPHTATAAERTLLLVAKLKRVEQERDTAHKMLDIEKRAHERTGADWRAMREERDTAIADAARLASYLEAHNLGATSTFNDPPPDITGMRADWWRAGRKAARDAGELATARAERDAARGKAWREAAAYVEAAGYPGVAERMRALAGGQ